MQHAAEGSDRAARLIRRECQPLQWRGLTGRLCPPTVTAVGRVPDNAAGRPGNPYPSAVDGHRTEVEDLASLFREKRRRSFPDDTPIVRPQDQAPVAHHPSAVVAAQLHVVKAFETEATGANVEHATAVNASDLAFEPS